MNIEHLANEYIFGSEMELNYQKPVDFSHAKISDISMSIFDSCFGPPVENLNGAIVRFYILNQAIHLLKQKHHNLLPKESHILFTRYEEELENSSRLIFTYLTVACAMEARHCEDILKNKDWETITEKATHEYIRNHEHRLYGIDNVNELHDAEQRFEDDANEYAQQVFERMRQGKIESLSYCHNEFQALEKVYGIIEKIEGRDEYESYHVSDSLLPQFTDVRNDSLEVGQFLNQLITIFERGSFEEGFGGEAWAKITQHVLDFTQGKISAEVFVDQAFSLEHNSGQVFNKRMIFQEPSAFYLHSLDMHSERAGEHLIKSSTLLLNMQHEGELLSFMNTPMGDLAEDLSLFSADYNPDVGINSAQRKIIEHLKTLFPFYQEHSDELIYSSIYLTQKNLTHFQLEFFDEFQTDPLLVQILKEIRSLDVRPEGFHLTPIVAQSEFEYQDCDMSVGREQFFSLFDRVCSPKRLEGLDKHQPFFFKWFSAENVPENYDTKQSLGNKAFGLRQMQQDGLPVPKALILPTQNARSFNLHREIWNEHMKQEVSQMLSQFDSLSLVSVRSGAAVSMPGMMDTILNVGIDDSNYEALCEKMGKEVVDKCAMKFMSLLAQSRLDGEGSYWQNLDQALESFKHTLNMHDFDMPFEMHRRFPFTREEQVCFCVETVFDSWYSQRAIAYRTHHNISDDIGTAAIIQEMVFGNLNYQSATGVVFSRNCVTGQAGMVGEYLAHAQGEDVVSGSVTPSDIATMKVYHAQCYKELEEIAKKLENQYGEVQDIEFTIENNKLYILQHRAAVCSSQAKVYLDNQQYEQGLITQEELINRMSLEALEAKTQVITQGQQAQSTGLIGNMGVVRGMIIHRAEDMKQYHTLYQEMKAQYPDFGWILHANTTSPEHTLLMLKTKGFITDHGGFTSHAAILARAWKKPCVVGIGYLKGRELSSGTMVTLDANTGQVYTAILPLSENSEQVKASTQMVLEHFGVDVQKMMSYAKKFSTQPSWMEPFANALSSSNNINSEMKTEKFLSLGEKAAMILLKHQQEKKLKMS